jgi:hypothetical protein
MLSFAWSYGDGVAMSSDLVSVIVANGVGLFFATTHKGGAAAAVFLACPINSVDRSDGSFTLE